MKEYKLPLGNVAQTLADGRTVAPGERVKLSDKEVADDARLFSEGKLIPVSSAGEEIVEKAVSSYQRSLSGEEAALEELVEQQPETATTGGREGGSGR